MESVRKGLRAGNITKDTYDRLLCAVCEKTLGKRNDPDEIGTIRFCTECGREWSQVR